MSPAEAGFENQNQNQTTDATPQNFYESMSNYFTSESFNNTLSNIKDSISTTANQFLPGLELDFGTGGESNNGEASGLDPTNYPQSNSQKRPLEGQAPHESARSSSNFDSLDKSESFRPPTGDQSRAQQQNLDAGGKTLPKEGDRPEPESKEVAPESGESIETTRQRALEGGSASIAHQLAEQGQLSPEARNFLDTVHRHSGPQAASQVVGLINENLSKMGSDYRLQSNGQSVTPMKGGVEAGPTHWFPNPKVSNAFSAKPDLKPARP